MNLLKQTPPLVSLNVLWIDNLPLYDQNREKCPGARRYREWMFIQVI